MLMVTAAKVRTILAIPSTTAVATTTMPAETILVTVALIVTVLILVGILFRLLLIRLWVLLWSAVNWLRARGECLRVAQRIRRLLGVTRPVARFVLAHG